MLKYIDWKREAGGRLVLQYHVETGPVDYYSVIGCLLVEMTLKHIFQQLVSGCELCVCVCVSVSDVCVWMHVCLSSCLFVCFVFECVCVCVCMCFSVCIVSVFALSFE